MSHTRRLTMSDVRKSPKVLSDGMAEITRYGNTVAVALSPDQMALAMLQALRPIQTAAPGFEIKKSMAQERAERSHEQWFGPRNQKWRGEKS